MAFWNSAELQLEEFRPGILSKAEIGSNLIMACMEIGPNQEDAGHEHIFEQCGIVLEGYIEMFIEDEYMTLGPNQCYFIRSGALHGWKTGAKPVRILDVSAKLP
jgi:mannose-6-phosphate isomerase-like protein (cupin superfamily)